MKIKQRYDKNVIEALKTEGGEVFGGTDLGMCTLVMMLLHIRRKKNIRPNRERLYWYAKDCMLNGKWFQHSNDKKLKTLVDKCVSVWEDPPSLLVKKYTRDFEYKDAGGAYWLFQDLARDDDKGDAEFIILDEKKIIRAIKDWFPNVFVYINVVTRPVGDRLYPEDPLLDYFYQRMIEKYNYHAIMKEMGLSEQEIPVEIKKKSYQSAMKSAREIIELGVMAEVYKGAQEGERSLIATVLKEKDKDAQREPVMPSMTKDFSIRKNLAPMSEKQQYREKEITLNSHEEG